MKPKQRLISTSFQYVILDQCKDESYRDAAEKINLHYNRTGKEAIKIRTIADQVEVVGSEINEHISDLAGQALADHDFNPETGLPLEEAALPDSFVHPNPEGVSERFVPIGQSEPVQNSPHEYSYCDDANEVLCRLEIRQVEKTKVDEQTKNVFYIVQGNEATDNDLLLTTARKIVDETIRYCGGKGRIIIPKVNC